MTEQTTANAKMLRRVLLKAALLLLVCNVLFALRSPLPALGRISAYNHLFPGRARLPFGENPAKAYNLSLFQMEAMFASHEIAAADKAPDEYRVIVIGDSSVWGFLLTPQETLTAYINQAGHTIPAGKRVRAYNLGYPTISLSKDLLLLDYALRYQPDLIVWLVTLESFPYEKQVFTPLVQQNPQAMRRLIGKYTLQVNPQDPQFSDPTWLQKTLIGQRRTLADMARLQLYGVLWAATGVDQHIPESYTPRQEDLAAEENYYGLTPPTLHASDIAFDVLAAGVSHAGQVPVLLVNEPMFVSAGENSAIRYNFFYPRWAYDAYRQLLAEQCAAQGWLCLDLWDAIPGGEFTNSAIHLTPSGSAQLAGIIGEAIVKLASAQD
ncbi:MAG: hypothetical protein OEZ02_01940 [Anaerolineae bacterium]|nr:hypothetical protein [Anaerolineae bacterium]